MSSGIVAMPFEHQAGKDKHSDKPLPHRIRYSTRGFYIGSQRQRLSKYYKTFEQAEEELICGTFSRD